MNLDRIMFAASFDSTSRVEAFLASDDVRKSKFGDLTQLPQPIPAKHLIQPDGFRITVASSRLQVDYSMPRDMMELDEDPFTHIVERMRRFIKAVSNLGDGKAEWLGMQTFFEEPDPTAITGKEALANWAAAIQAPMFKGIVPTHFGFSLGSESDGFFESVTVQPYELRVGSALPNQVIADQDLEKITTVSGTGIQFIVDINTRPRKSPERVDRAFKEVSDRLKSDYNRIIEGAISAIKGKSPNV